MILSIIVIVVLGLVAYFHYTQGLFSASASLVAAALAAFAAWGFHEPLARASVAALGIYGPPVALVLIFALVYVVLRVILDGIVTGNTRFNPIVDKVGAGVIGLLAAFFPTAIIAIAAQMMPTGSSVMMHARYPLVDGEYGAPNHLARTNYRIRDPRADNMVEINNVVTVETIGTDAAQAETAGLWLPVDQWFISLAGGNASAALAGPADFNTIYPGGFDGYADAIYARRLGRQQPASGVAINLGERTDVTLGDRGGLFLLDQGTEGVEAVAGDDYGGERPAVPNPYRAAGQNLLVVRVLFGDDAKDDRDYVRFGPANARLVLGNEQYFPIGTLESGRILVVQGPDDRLLASTGADFVYQLPDDVFATADKTELVEPAFLEFKTFAVVPLGNERVYQVVTADSRTQVARKMTTRQRISVLLTGGELPNAVNERDTEAFDALRDALPELAADPEAAESFEQPAVPDVPADEPDAEAAADDEAASPAVEENRGGILDGMRDRNNERREQVE